jgi:hypothetical protein
MQIRWGSFVACFFMRSLLFAYKRYTIIKKTIRAVLAAGFIARGAAGIVTKQSARHEKLRHLQHSTIHELFQGVTADNESG